MPVGETEVEIYSTHTRTEWGDPSVSKLQFQLEIEHGITNRWDVSLYQVFEQAAGNDGAATISEPFHYTETKVRTRYRFSERGELPVDLLGYLELIKAFGEDVYAVEAKAIVARDFGIVTGVLNLIGEVKFGGDVDETEVELGWTAGVTAELDPRIKVGVETWAAFEVEEPDGIKVAVGPAVSWAPSDRFWVTTTVGFGVTDTSDAFSTRVLFGLHL